MRFHLIDALRGVAAIWVVLFHAYEGRHIDGLAEVLPDYFVYLLFELGDAGVPIFFVISGFVIAHSITRDRVDSRYLIKFTIRRSIRLDPPYWGSIILVIFMAWLSSTIKNEPVEWPGIQAIMAHMFYVQGILEIQHINIIYWTLCLEIQFYLIFCILVSFTQLLERYYKFSFIAVFSSAAIISLMWPTTFLLDNVYPGLFLPHWHAFLLGVFAYWSWQKRLPSHFFYIYSGIILFSSYFTHSDFSMAAALTAIFVHECAKFGHITAANYRWIQFLGTISYSLYLTHNPITGASYYILYRLFGNSTLIQLFAFLISTTICILVAYIFWWLFESWSIKFSKKITLHNRIKNT